MTIHIRRIPKKQNTRDGWFCGPTAGSEVLLRDEAFWQTSTTDPEKNRYAFASSWWLESELHRQHAHARTHTHFICHPHHGISYKSKVLFNTEYKDAYSALHNFWQPWNNVLATRAALTLPSCACVLRTQKVKAASSVLQSCAFLVGGDPTETDIIGDK